MEFLSIGMLMAFLAYKDQFCSLSANLTLVRPPLDTVLRTGRTGRSFRGQNKQGRSIRLTLFRLHPVFQHSSSPLASNPTGVRRFHALSAAAQAAANSESACSRRSLDDAACPVSSMPASLI